ncbi:MAG: transposase [Sutterella wadsworthensis]
MVVADGTFIEAPSSTKNKAHARDPEMASGKKANTWHFGMKEHIAACSESGIIYGTVAAPANEHDITHLGDLLKGLEKKVILDSGYIGCHKRAEILAIPFKDVSWYIAARPSAWKKELSISENFGGELGQALVECVNVKRQLEHAKASVRCSIEVVLPLAEEDLWLCQGSLSRVGEKSQSSAHVVCSLQLQPLAQMVRSAKATLLITPKLWCALRLECHGALPTLENDICPIFRQISSCFSIIRKNRTTNVHGNFRRFSTPGQKSFV